MNLEPKIQNPVCIKLGKNSGVILDDDNSYSLEPGVMFGGERYGFVLICDYGKKQREYVYPTQCKIDAIGMDGEYLKIFETEKKECWKFDKKGTLKQSAFSKLTDEFREKIDVICENFDMFVGNLKLENPIRIKISQDSKQSAILHGQEVIPLYPGAIFGDIHYGFILIFETSQGSKEVIYPTQNNIDAVGFDDIYYSDLRVFENGKYNPWLFTYDGKLKKQASYNQFSRKDKKFIEKEYFLNNRTDDIFTLQKRV